MSSYRMAQAECKRLGLKASGTKEVLLARIRKHKAGNACASAQSSSSSSSSLVSPTRRTGPKSFKKALSAKMAAVGANTNARDSARSKKRQKKSPKKESPSSSAGTTAAEIADLADLAKLTRDKIEARFHISGKKGKEGTTFIACGKSGARYAIKLFKSTKSPNAIEKEANLQKKAAAFGVSPRVLAVNLTQKYIIMDCLKETIVDVMKRLYPGPCPSRPLSEAYQQRIIEICEKLDEAGVVQNDGNPLNLMVDDAGALFVIDFGFAKPITPAVLKKRGTEPNINLTLWHFERQLSHYRIKAPLCRQRVDQYMNAFKASKK